MTHRAAQQRAEDGIDDAGTVHGDGISAVPHRLGDGGPHRLSHGIPVGTCPRRVPRRQHGRSLPGIQRLDTLVDDHLAVGIGDRCRQLDLERPERLQQRGQSVRGHDLRRVDRQPEGDLRFAVQLLGAPGLQDLVQRQACVAAR